MNESCGVEDSSAISTKIHGMFSDRAPELSRIQRIEKLGMSEIILQYEAETKKNTASWACFLRFFVNYSGFIFI